jgi:hypothetical protein
MNKITTTLLVNKVRNYAYPNNCATLFGLNISRPVRLKEKSVFK